MLYICFVNYWLPAKREKTTFMTKTKKIFGIALLFVAFYSCKIHSPNHASSNIVENDREPKRIAMILLNISNSDGDYSTSIVSSRIIETAKEFKNNKKNVWHENDFVCFILDKHKNIIDTLLIFQPLHPRFEYPEDDGIIGSVVIEQKNNNVLLRFNYLSTMKYLRIEKVEENDNLKLIDVLEIPLIQ